MAGEILKNNLAMAGLAERQAEESRYDRRLEEIRDSEGPVPPPLVRVITDETREQLRHGDEGPIYGETPITYKFVPKAALYDLRAAGIGKKVLEVIGRDLRDQSKRLTEICSPRGLSVNGGIKI